MCVVCICVLGGGGAVRFSVLFSFVLFLMFPRGNEDLELPSSPFG